MLEFVSERFLRGKWEITVNGHLWFSDIKSKVRFLILFSKCFSCCCFSIMCQTFVIQVSFRSSERLPELDRHVYAIETLFNLNSHGNKKLELFSQRTYGFQISERKLSLSLITKM